MRPISMISRAMLATLALGACQPAPDGPPAAASAPPPSASAGMDTPAKPGAGLAGTAWTLVGFQSMDDAQGTSRPAAGRVHTLDFGADGSLALQLDCNRGQASWKASPGGEGGALTIGPVASTRAFCPPSDGPDMAQMMAARLPDVASYTLRDGHLFLALKMDSGIFEFAPR